MPRPKIIEDGVQVTRPESAPPIDRPVKIDCYRGLGDNDMAPDQIKNLVIQPKADIKDLAHKVKAGFARNLNRLIGMEQGNTPHVKPENVVLAKRCSAAFNIATRFLNWKIRKEGDVKNPQVLLVYPAYNLFTNAFSDKEGIGWQEIYTEDFRKVKETGSRLADIERKLQENPSIRAIVINSPNNPTCEVYDNRFLRGIVDLLRKYENLHVISDVVYEKLAPDHGSVFRLAERELRDRILEVTGISKLVMPGDRNSCGFLYTSKYNAEIIDSLLDPERKDSIAKEESHILDVRRLSAAKTANEIGDEFFIELREHYRERRETIIADFSNRFKCYGIKLVNPDNLFYVTLDFKNCNIEGLTAKKFVEDMLNEKSIRLLPPERIGVEDQIRFSLGSVFVHKNSGIEFKSNGRIEDFGETYTDYDVTSDMRVHDIVFNTAVELLREKSLQEKIAPIAPVAEQGHAANIKQRSAVPRNLRATG